MWLTGMHKKPDASLDTVSVGGSVLISSSDTRNDG